MFIKLSFTSNTRLTVPLRIVTDIINTPNITSVSALQSRFTSEGYDATLTANFDSVNSMIVRTSSPTNTKAHYSSYGSTLPSYGACEFTVEHSVYDNITTKFYSQIASASGASANSTYYYSLGDSITGGTIEAAGLPVTIPENLTTGQPATRLILGGNPLSLANAIAGPTSSGGNNIRTFWMYITDKCMIWGTTNTATYNSGFGTTYTDPTTFSGPFIVSQYTRYDYHNSDSNGIIPVMFSSPRGAGIGWGTTADTSTTQNPLFTTNTTSLPMRVYNLISAAPQVGSAWPKIYNPPVQVTIAGRGNENAPFTYGQLAGTAANFNTASLAGVLNTTASTRFASSNLTSNTFGLLPFGWQHTYYGNYGGNASDQGGFYVFNGDYVPGDTFTFNNTVYMIWPLYQGYSSRIGIAIPMV